MKNSQTPSKKSKLDNLKLFYEELPDNGNHPISGLPRETQSRVSRPRR